MDKEELIKAIIISVFVGLAVALCTGWTEWWQILLCIHLVLFECYFIKASRPAELKRTPVLISLGSRLLGIFVFAVTWHQHLPQILSGSKNERLHFCNCALHNFCNIIVRKVVESVQH